METVLKSAWQRSKLLVKGLLIGLLVILLMIPAYFVENVIKEREDRQKEAITEVSSKWAGKQNITGPVLALPYKEQIIPGSTQTETKLAYILPDNLNIDADVKPEERHRGIYEVLLYSSVIKMSGKFNPVLVQQMNIDPANVLWNEAYVCMDLADPHGLREDINFKWNDSTVKLNPAAAANAVMLNGFQAPVNFAQGLSADFSATISINGSEQLLFTPVGKETVVKLSSAWANPGFTGTQLPDHRVTTSGFTATWRSLALTRNFPQSWKTGTFNLQSSSFGANLVIPVSSYQKTMRSVKYAILCILLTFAAFFIIETVNKK
jgi:inner membrane protein